MRAWTTTTAMAAGLMLLAACSSEPADNTASADNMLDNMMAEMPAEEGGTSATASLRSEDGTAMGTATATEANGGIQVTVDVTGMPAGEHGFHIHQIGACDAPGFETAGGHWNPTDSQHGLENPEGPHAGDMPNLTVAEDGTGTVTATLPAGTFEGLMDADGSAVIVHAGPDDMRTDPSGDSGARIACGVLTAA